MNSRIYIARRHEITIGFCGTDEDPKTIGVFLTRQEADELVEVDERCWVADNNEDPINLDRDAHVYDDCSDTVVWKVEEAEIDGGVAFTKEELEDLSTCVNEWLEGEFEPYDSKERKRVEALQTKLVTALFPNREEQKKGTK